MKKYFLFILISIFSLAFTISAQEKDPFSEISFPVIELGNCQNKEDCELYCEKLENMETCLIFAEDHALLTGDEIEMGREMLALGVTAGPGGCRSEVECELYCDDIDHIEECIIFAKEHNLIPAEELVEAEKVLAAIKRGLKPPNCRGKRECDIYCSQPQNMEECIAFGEAAGLIPAGELGEAKMVLEAIRKGAKPPPCQGEQECDAYCSEPAHLEECLAFAEAAGFMSPEEAEMARRTGGKGPGGCRGEQECEAFCENPENMKECMEFALKHGFMSPEEAEETLRMLEAGFKAGPGDCQGQEECEAYCNDLAHMEECVNFAEKTGMMSAQEAAKARKMAEMGVMGGPGGCQSEEDCRAFCENPANIKECMDFTVKIGEMSPEEAEKIIQRGERMERGGPGGCRSEEECMAYCENPDHAEECIIFAVEIGEMSEEEARQIKENKMREMQEMEEMMRREEMMKQEMMREEQKMMFPEPDREGPESYQEGIMPPEGEMVPGGIMSPEGILPFEEEKIEGVPGEMMGPMEEIMPLEEIKTEIMEEIMTAPEMEPFKEIIEPIIEPLEPVLESLEEIIEPLVPEMPQEVEAPQEPQETGSQE